MQQQKQSRVYLLPVILFLLLSMLFISAGVYLVNDDRTSRVSKASSLAKQVVNSLELFSTERRQAMINLMQAWPAFSPNEIDWFNVQAVSLMNIQHGYTSLSLVDKNGVVRWISLPRNHAQSVSQLANHGGIPIRAGLPSLSPSEQFQSVLRRSDKTGHYFLIYGRAISSQQPELGFVVATFDISETLNVIMGELVGPQFNFMLLDKNSHVLEAGDFVEDGSVISISDIQFLGRQWSLRIQSRPATFNPGFLIGVVGVLMSLLVSWTFHKQLKGAMNLTQSQQLYRTASDAALDALLIYQLRNGEFVLLEANRMSFTMFPYLQDEAVSATLHEHMRLLGHESLTEAGRKVVFTGEPFEGFLKVECASVPSESLKVQMVKADKTLAMTFRDVTTEQVLQKEVSWQASHDQLTGLLNRYAFDSELKTLLEQVKQGEKTGVMCFIDMDRFKLVNDSCGHPAGDKLLKEVAELFASHLEPTDLLARIGGDEFCIIFAGQTITQATAKLDIILEAIASYRFIHEDRLFYVGASIGVIAIDQESGSAAELIKAADNACYQAKYQGRNRYIVVDSLNNLPDAHSESNVLQIVHRALREHKFELYSQSIVPMTSVEADLQHYEILLRLPDGQGGLISPGLFIPLAERHGLMNLIDGWVVDQTLTTLEAYPDHLEHLGKVAINLSGLTLGDPAKLDHIVKRVMTSKVPAHKICFEITETAAVTNISAAKHFIHTLREKGCLFALDDFGAGMSSFTYLKNLDVDFVKIDGSFVKNMASDSIDHETVKAINAIAQSMGKQTIAEFVTDDATCKALKALNVDFGQGFALGKPLPLMNRLQSRDNVSRLRA
ncbi:putative bifunctional diguanylate cyclase/phosphodiesterase [Alteromonas confluentis]|uniref:Diguanylate cyclase n=1 Tax=Alteromonas confluentis TaxID=1656094 RepID=A0A1E7Z5K6_9ALTE|nr:EAL domain-containing protein [Alteromonas confluentis]OFC68815.1 hypothetical protein BFC18_00855 [Alteromonas confluentis]